MLVNKSLVNKIVATAYGQITFNDKGESNDLTAAQQKELGNLPGFKYKEDKKEAVKKEKEKEVKTEEKPKAKKEVKPKSKK